MNKPPKLSQEQYISLINRHRILSLIKMLQAATKKDIEDLQELADNLADASIKQLDIVAEANRCFELDKQAYQIFSERNYPEQESV